MKRPWQIWLLYALGLAIVVPAFAWLTIKALELDRAESLARRQAELEEDISRALWRMDSLLTPLLAEEAARPDVVYQPVLEAESAGKKSAETKELSPLLAEPPPFVLLHFEVRSDGHFASPQAPRGFDNAWALKNGVSPAAISLAEQRLSELRPALSFDVLLAKLPAQTLPHMFFGADVADNESNAATFANPVIANSYADYAQQAVPQPGPPPPNQTSANQSNLQQDALQSAAVSQSTNLPANPEGTQPNVPPAEGQGGYGQPSGSYGGNVESGRLQRSQSRAGNDLPNRGAALQAYAQRSYENQRQNFKEPTPVRVVEGISRPIWIDGRLLLARRVQVGGQTIVQGCWLDWPSLKKRLRDEVADLLPHVELTPVTTAEPIQLSRVLATIPVQLSVPELQPPAAAWSPIRVSLIVAWACLLLTAFAAAVTLQGIMTLSERRGAFVSAVTHELRTPLTTFRMYAEMLAGGMVPDANQRQQYLETLRIEADRLSHLVENVLHYARLERGRPGGRREPVSVDMLLSRCQSRLADRADQAGMKLVLDSELNNELTIATDSAAVEQILFNLVDNACKYAVDAKDKRIHLAMDAQPRSLAIVVRDHGPGISTAGRRRLFRPFSKSVHEAASSAPGVGLGLALSRRLAHDLGGKLELKSAAEGGAAFVLTLPLS